MKKRKLKPCQTRRRASVRNLHRSWKDIVAHYVEMAREKAKDHAAYFGDFMSLWQEAITNVGIETATFRKGPRVLIKEEDREIIAKLYGWMALTRFSFLMDHLSFEEEEQLRAVSSELDFAWELFLSTVRMQHPGLAVRTEEVRGYQHALQRIVTDMYLGEEPAVFSPEWSAAYKGFMSAFAALCEEVLHD